MKKLFILLMISSQGITCAMAQGTGFRLGLEGGANLDKISGQSFNQEFNFNYFLGAYANFGLSKGFGIQPEVIFSQSTATTTTNFNSIYNQSGIAQRHASLQYLSIPILASIALAPRIYLQLGPQYSIMINEDRTLVDNGAQAFKSGNFAFVGGFWFRLPAHINLLARYSAGLGNINNLGDQDKWTSQSIQLGVGLTL
ncbi:MAG TPA: outer membrane beta-barrel protein [Chitinophagaceae bacterium]|nr:outer membrane beta-barrel protein [Chitinophagaceae bacterium]